MEHSFDVDTAELYGVNSAILFKNIYFWVEKNKANEIHFYDGNYWTYNSIKAFSKMFPYMTEKQIRLSLEKLENAGLIETGNFNKAGYDRTKWYAITPKGQMHFTKKANGICQKGKPIPDINTDINNIYSANEENIKKTSTKDIEELFENVWKLYHNKKGKGQVSKSKKKELYSIGYEELKRCVNRYVAELKKEEWRKPQNGSTFFNSGYVDYLDENYKTNDVKMTGWNKNAYGFGSGYKKL